MSGRDFFYLTTSAIRAKPMQSILTGLGIGVGISAVVLLTSMGEGLHQYVLSEFTQFGTNLIAVNPGKITTMGTPLGIIGTVRPLSLKDAEALATIPRIKAVVPVVQGNAEVEGGVKSRRATVYGVGPDMPEAFKMRVISGRFLPRDNPETPRAYAVLGSKMKKELFGSQSPLGRRIRVGGHRFVITGVMEPKGQILGFDMDDTVFIPAGRALEVFNKEGLIEIDVLYREEASDEEVVKWIKRLLIARHGQDDFTITTQQQMLDVLGSVLGILTIAVGALGGISLLVGCVGIVAVMTIAVTERTSEIGLLMAIGATKNQILALFLGEAVLLAGAGGAGGLLLGTGGGQIIKFLLPALPVHTSWYYVILAEGLAVLMGLLAGVLPARHAAQLDPIEALREE